MPEPTITSPSSTPKKELFPVYATDQTEGIHRYEAIPDAESMKATALFGIPLVSTLTNETVPDATIQKYIDQAISELEHSLDMYILPVKFSDRYDWARHEMAWSFNYLKLDHGNVRCVNRVTLTFTNDESQDKFGFIDFPLQHVYIRAQEGVCQLVPAFGSSLSGFLLSAFSGTQYHALGQSGIGHFPGGIRVEYECGFAEGRLPAVLASLIENMAAYKLLSILGPVLFPTNSVSISIDGTSQSTGTLGPAFLNQRLGELEKIMEKEMDAVKGYYQKKFQVDFF